MISSFGDKATQRIWEGLFTRRLPVEVQQVGRRKLRMINSAQSLQDLLIPPANRLEKLKGDQSKYYSIRINGQWRIIFQWNQGNAEAVQIIDYH
jgi:proteic killer suppression protein